MMYSLSWAKGYAKHDALFKELMARTANGRTRGVDTSAYRSYEWSSTELNCI